MGVRVQTADFDIGSELNALKEGRDVGALVSFSGIVRGEGGLIDMTLEHYPGMTERALQKIASDATSRFALSCALIIHRHGTLRPGEQIMMVAAGAAHRQAAFDGANFMMDYLKSRAPFWKSERFADGARWVAAKDQDEAAREAWEG